MQIKTVNKIIRKKMSEWLNTLPKKLRDDVQGQILVSGGCIASMLLKEDVNDFDVYIQDQDVLMKLAEHYAKDKNLTVLDGREKDALIDKLVPEKKMLDEFKLKRGKGVANFPMEQYAKLMSLDPMQVRMDIPDSGYAYIVKEKSLVKNPYQTVFLSPNAISLTNKVQIVLRFSGDATEIHKNFDFIHATNYWTWADGLVTNKAALESLITKQLFYQGSLFPLTSIIRMKKFVLRHWKISAGEIFKIMWQISALDLRDPVLLKNQLVGVDIAYFAELIDKLNQREPKEWSSEFINTTIDEVFNDSDSEV